METVYGYIRVSTREQNEARQRIAMKDYGVSSECIYMDKQSGKDFNRPQYKKLMKRLRQDDVLVIKSIDRLGRNYEEILAQWRYISQNKQARIVVLDMPLLDTGMAQNLTRQLISDIVLQLLSYVAQTERENILKRQAEGIAAAKQRGVHMGRPRIPIPEQFDLIRNQYLDHRLTARSAARLMGVSHTTFLRWIREKM